MTFYVTGPWPSQKCLKTVSLCFFDFKHVISFEFLLDIDMIPSPGLDLSLDSFLSKPSGPLSPKLENLSNFALVVPVYEVTTDVKIKMPANKTELQSGIKVNSINQYIYYKSLEPCVHQNSYHSAIFHILVIVNRHHHDQSS